METTVGCRRTLPEWEYDEQSVPVIIGGYESGEGPEGHDLYTFEPNLTTLELSFDTDDYDELIDRLFLLYGPIKIIGIGNGRWSVETTDAILGTIIAYDHARTRTVFGTLDVSKNNEKTVGSNGTSTVVPLNTVVNRVCGGSP